MGSGALLVDDRALDLMALVTTTTPDKKYSRVWSNMPAVVWRCNTCFCLVAQADLGAHANFHTKAEGFGS